MNTQTTPQKPVSRQLVIAAFATIYIAWGGTFFGIRMAIETIPPLLMAGTRFLLAGIILLAAVRLISPHRFVWGGFKEWKEAAVVGILLIVAGNGGITWAEQSIPSGIASLTMALIPMWLLLFDWLRPRGVVPRPMALLGLVMGLGGVILLVKDNGWQGSFSQQGLAYGILLGGGISWACGAIYSRYVATKSAPLLMIGRQMLIGGILLIGLAALHGELSSFHFAAVSQRSAWAFLYLLIFGSLLGFSAYVWLMGISTPARVGTTSYINPMVAVFLGVTWGGEVLSLHQMMGGVLVLVAVILLSLSKR